MKPFTHFLLLAFTALTVNADERVKRAKDAPPEVRLLSPGFTVTELPVQLTNAVNLQYRHDGKLVVLGYNGDIHLLSDTDGDGLEDRATLFWKGSDKVSAPIGMDLTGRILRIAQSIREANSSMGLLLKE